MGHTGCAGHERRHNPRAEAVAAAAVLRSHVRIGGGPARGAEEPVPAGIGANASLPSID